MKVLVAGFGNPLRGDDGFGIRVLSRLERHPKLPPNTYLLEVGIGGISLVQELESGYEGLVVLDAVEGEEAGSVQVLELTVLEPGGLTIQEKRDYFADVHYAEPGRALALAKAVGSLPSEAYLVGCVPQSCELGEELSKAVESALDLAVSRVLELLSSLSSQTATASS